MKYLFLFLLLIGCGRQELASESEVQNSDQLQEKVIIVALEEKIEWGYYQYIENGEHRGFEVDLLNRFSDESDYEVKYVKRPWKRAMEEVRHGTIDVLISSTMSEERAKVYAATDVIYEIHQVLYYSKERFPDGVSFGRQEDIEKYKTGAVLGYNVDALQFDVSSSAFPTINSLFSAVHDGRIDFAVAYLELEEFNKHKKPGFAYVKIPNHDTLKGHWLVKKGSPRSQKTLKLLNEFIKELKDSGEYDAMEAKYLKGGE